MADRTVKVTLAAQVSNYIAGMEQAAAATRSISSETQKLAAQKQAFTEVGRGALLAGGIIAAGMAVAINAFAEFDAKMSQVHALSHASADDMQKLSDAAMNAGIAFGFSAAQTADAEIELVKAGVSVKDILGGALKGSLELAAAGQIDVAQATEIATIALTQFGLQGSDIPHVADLLAAGADKALGGVADLGEALKSGGLVAAQFGISLDETVGTLSAFANAGLLGETAGTDLRQMLLKLSAPSKQAADDMSKYGISIYDAQGKFVGLSDLAGQLKTQLGGLDEATRNQTLATIFGSRAIAGANVLYKEGAEGISKWTNSVNDTGFAASQAAGKMNNLQGDVTKLGSAFQNDLIKSGSAANDILRGTVQHVTGLLNAIATVPAPVLGVGMAVAGLAAGVLVLGGGFLTIVPKIQATKLAMQELNLTGSTVAKTFGKGGAILAGLTSLVGGFANLSSSTELSTDKLSAVNSALNNMSKGGDLNSLFQNAGTSIIDTTAKTQKLKEALNAVASGNFWENESGVAKFVDGATLGLTHLSDVYKTNEAQFRQMGSVLAETSKTDLGKATDGFNQIVKAAGGGKEAVRQLLSQMPEYKATLTDLASQQGKTLTEQGLFNLAQGKGALAAQISAAATAKQDAALAKLTGTAKDASGNISDLANQISDFGKANFDAADADRQFHQSIDDVTKGLQQQQDAYKNVHGSLDGFNASLDINTQEGRDNSANLEAIAKAALNKASADITQTGSQKDANAAISEGRDALIKALGQFGITGQAANDYADKLGLIPGNVDTYVNLHKTQAQIDAENFQATLDHLTRNIDIAVNIHGANNLANVTGGVANANGGMYSYADGGFGAGIYSGGAPLYKFAEPETGWEAFISGKSSERRQNQQTWAAAGRMLGMSPGAAGGGGERPIYMDGNLFGVLREMANGEARIVLNQANARQNLTFGAGKQKGTF